jgi:protein TonB
MKSLYTLGLLVIISLSLNAQTNLAKDVTVTTSLSGPDSAFKKVEIESEFPGGIPAWMKFLSENLTYPDKAVRKNIQGTVVLQFIVCTDGSVCDIEAISGPPLLREAAVKALKNTPNWTPAVQGGKKVKSYKKQPITFRLQ